MSTPNTPRFPRNHSDVHSHPDPLSFAGIRMLARGAYLNLAGGLRRQESTPTLRCLYLHYVFDDQIALFRRLLQRLQQLGSFVGASEVGAILRGEHELEGHAFHLSIDDGFENIHRNAFPVLAELGIPATLFVPTRFVGASDDAVGGLWWNPRKAMMRPLAWQALREMRDAGFEIGTHTRHHVRLSDISGDATRLREELEGARHDVEEALSQPCRLMSWPFGTWRDIDDAAFEAIAAAGYELCFSAVRGRVEPGSTNPLAIPRHHFEPEWPWPHVRYFATGGREQP